MSSAMRFAVSRQWRVGRAGLGLVVLLCGCEERTPPRPPAQTPQAVERLPSGTPSPDGRFTGVLLPNESPPALELYEVKPRLRLARVAIAQAASVRPWSPSLQWTVEDHVLLRWSTASAESTGLLYDTQGTPLLEVSGTSFTVSPSARYLVTYPTQLTQKPVIRIYDLGTGKLAVQRESDEGAEGTWIVETLDWQGPQLLAIYHDRAHTKRSLRIPLDAVP